MKTTLLISIFFLFITKSAFSQDTIRHDSYVRLTLTLVDSIGIDHQFNDTTIKTMYKFEIKKLYKGVYNYPYMYVGAREETMRHFNTLLNTGVLYWWGVTDTKEWYLGIPIYRHSSSW